MPQEPDRLQLRLEAPSGATISDMIVQGIIVATKLDINVMFIFNSVPVYCYPNEHPLFVLKRYYKDLKKEPDATKS